MKKKKRPTVLIITFIVLVAGSVLIFCTDMMNALDVWTAAAEAIKTRTVRLMVVLATIDAARMLVTVAYVHKHTVSEIMKTLGATIEHDTGKTRNIVAGSYIVLAAASAVAGSILLTILCIIAYSLCIEMARLIRLARYHSKDDSPNREERPW